MQTQSEILSKTPTITAGAYSANDVVGGQITLTGAVRQGGRTAVLQSLVLVDKVSQKAVMDLFIFDQQVSTIADNAAEAFTDADMVNCVGVVNIAASDYLTNANNSIATINNIGLLVQASSSGTARTLYAYLVTRGTPTYTSTSDLVLKTGFLQD